jgi:hypothetical protein
MQRGKKVRSGLLQESHSNAVLLTGAKRRGWAASASRDRRQHLLYTLPLITHTTVAVTQL